MSPLRQLRPPGVPSFLVAQDANLYAMSICTANFGHRLDIRPEGE
jgi:hypothetical protein